ncbi:PREDICTED: uncharacterized protein LOC104743286 [Camelina sativa]|uniref:Uncharacterized protein LOC104743286 n=1 Tax=Camelina sativa TaxID=90675 RepID=A0ABM0VXS7_CAMSA|nr:PREDICTED: uncharacterized protein LOC104743286 [Camelina sativa]
MSRTRKIKDVHAEGKTGVFWDVVDFPIPTAECDPDLISKKIKSALDEKGCYNGPVSISLYDDVEDDKITKQELIDKYEAAGVSLNFVPKVAEAHGYERVHKMFLDIGLCVLKKGEWSNLIILSKYLKEIEMLAFLGYLRSFSINVEASEVIPPTERSEWLWLRLCESLPSQGSGSSQL